MSNYQIQININGVLITTLSDILHDKSGFKILFIGKCPVQDSVNAGHYFQGRQGEMFWNKLKEYNLLNVPAGEYEDDYLIAHGYGITDIVKISHPYGKNPSAKEYKTGIPRIMQIIYEHQPRIIVFVYKKPLDKILKYKFKRNKKSTYGFNKELRKLFRTQVFVFPMPGTPCNGNDAHQYMTQLTKLIWGLSNT